VVKLLVQQGFCTLPLIEKQPQMLILAIAGLTYYQHRVLMVFRMHPNIHRAYLLGKAVLAVVDPNWSDSETFYITFPLNVLYGPMLDW
jgi:hypothetical protein